MDWWDTPDPDNVKCQLSIGGNCIFIRDKLSGIGTYRFRINFE